MKKVFLILIFPLFAFSNLWAQQFRIGEFDTYLSAYFNPVAKSFSTGMNSGWVHTAKAHGKLGFDFSISFAIVNIPQSEAGFSSNKLREMEKNGFYFESGNLSSKRGDVIKFPNIRSGGDAPAPKIYKQFSPIGQNISPTIDFNAIGGLDLALSPSASLQLTVGLPAKTDLIIRYFPDLSFSANKIFSASGLDIRMEKTNYWGLGIKHDIKQWIPVLKKMPFLQLSALLTYSNFYTGFSGKDLILSPDKFSKRVYSELPNSTWDNQKFNMNVKAFSGALLVGANIPVFQPFMGVGFNSGIFEAGLKGTYPIIEVNKDLSTISAYSFLVKKDGKEENPISIKSESTEFSFVAGARIKLGFFILHYQFTKQTYSMHTAGVAFTFR